jgi:putative hydrolase of the HAD superfamily
MIKGICFDLDGVYFTKAGMSGFTAELTTLCSNEVAVKEAVLSGSEILAFKRGKLSEKAFWDSVNKKLGLSLSIDEYKSLLAKHYEIDSNVRNVLLKTVALGYTPLICSNNFPTRIEVLDRKFGFLADFPVRIFSYEVGFMKPAIEIFQALVNKSGYLAEEIVYADDKEESLSGARSLGIQTHLYTDFDQYVAFLNALGVTW